MEQTTIITAIPFCTNTGAHEMNKLTKESIKKINEQQLKHIFERMQSRAIDGYFNLTIWEPLSSENKKFLEINGYKIWEELAECCTYEGQPAILTTISWEFVKEKGND